jgi:argininosuccinate lyase
MAEKNKGKSNLRGRFKKGVDKNVLKYVASIPFDQRLYKQDIAGSVAHARMLASRKLISKKDADIIVKGLESIRKEIEQGKFEFKLELEDIHMNIESRLFEKIGDAAGKLHTARSRNDQIALDLRLFVKEAIADTIGELEAFQSALLDLAEANKSAVMPGYTHLQQAQPVLFAHHILAYFEMLRRDVTRFRDCFKRTNVMPLGSGALAGAGYPIDRDFVARELGFGELSRNSLDAVSDRDFIIEYEAAAAITMMHLSRLAEEMVLWSSAEFGFIELDDAYTTSSSIMPQKKNPDVMELARGKTGTVYGNLIGLLTVMKGLPLAYNRDMQEDKKGLFDTVDTLLATLQVFTGLIKGLKINADQMQRAMSGSYLLATDLADYLVGKGLPFREAHKIVGELVQYAIGKGKSFQKLSIAEYRKFSPLFKNDVYGITIDTSIAARNIFGGTSPKQVLAALAGARKLIGKEQ